MYFQGSIWRKVSQQIIRILNTLPDARNCKIVVALSGGMDSVFMLAVLAQVKKKYRFELLPVYVNHGVQKEADLFGRIARSAAERMNLGCDILIVGKQPKSRNLENWMREERYRLLEAYRNKQKANYIAVAHHASDQAETVLAHLIRGAGMAGLRGMLPMRGKVVRPLLNCSKKDIKTLMQSSKLPYYEDKLNHSLNYQRNKIRHELIPYLEKEFNPRITERLAKLAENVQKENLRLTTYD